MNKRDDRKAEWFLTINESAECFKDVLDIVKSLNYETYGVILHDKDNVEQPHKHAYIKVKNAITFNSMLNKFKGAHIEIVKYTKKSIQYLVHKNDKDKYPYNPNDIISNNLEYLKQVIEEEEKQWETFNEFNMLEYIVDGTTSNYLFIKRFGPKVWKDYWKCYSELLRMQDLDEDLKQDLDFIREQRAMKTINELDKLNIPYEIAETGEIKNE